MPKHSKIEIFNVMDNEELDEELKNTEHTRREYQRLVAMKAISLGIPHNVVAEIVGVSYESIYRWAKSCSKNGMEGLMPNFNGGRISQLSIKEKLDFGNMLYLSDDKLSMTEARQLLIDKFGIEYSLTQVSNIISDLGFNYTTSRPEYIESPENKEQIVNDRIEKVNITDDDILLGVDESTIKTGHKTKKGIKLKSDKNSKK